MKPASAERALPAWHSMTAAEAVRAVGARLPGGLTAEEARRRLGEHGPNRLEKARKRGPWRMLLDQVADLMILLLAAAAVIAALAGDPADAVAIGAIVVLNAVLGFVQEYRAERAMEALTELAAPRAKVRRGGRAIMIDAADVVPGDALLLEAGAMVPADARVVETAALRVDESALTGESQAVEKSSAASVAADATVGDRVTMAYKGTLVTHGRALAVVVATGMRTELGRIASLLQEGEPPKTPLQRRLAALSRRLALAAVLLCAVVFAAGILRDEEPLLMFLTALSLAVAAVPEALPAVVTLSLAFGARRLARENALVRRLPAVETLGSVTYICTDKTGTLTRNRMEARAFRVDDARRDAFYTALAISNDVERGQGEPTEVALAEAAQSAGYEKDALEELLPRVAELAFTSERGLMSTLHRSDGKIIVFTKGAPEKVAAVCREPGDAVEAAADMAAEGLRVLAVAARELPDVPDRLDEAERDLELLGLVGLMDPPRPEAAAAVAECRDASINVVMITGDHPATAKAIAKQLGIHGDTLTGPQLARLSQAELDRRVESVRVYARVSPEQKIKIVQALQDRGQFASMTGDGVNDAPALRRANIGVAMGVTGTDVAREAAHMVLLDDNFATIVGAVREGRRIYDNIRKFIRYVLTGNTGEIALLLLAPFAGLPVPLLPIHILWVNLVTDGLPGLALAAEPAEPTVMKRPPRRPDESIFANGLGEGAAWAGMLTAALALTVQAWAYHGWSPRWQTMTFTVLVTSQLFMVLGLRSEREPLWRLGLLSNRPLLAAVSATFILQLAILYVPALNEVLKTQPLTPGELLLCVAVSPVTLLGVELEKAFRRAGRGFSGAAGR